MQTVKLVDFLAEYGDQIAQSVVKSYPPIYTFDKRENYVAEIKKLKRKPFLCQMDAICATAELFLTESCSSGVIVGEMGTGKSLVAAVIAYVCEFKKILIVAPPHLVLKWEREIKITLPDGVVECHHLKRFTDVDKAINVANASKDKFHVFIVGRERAKLSYQWRPAFNWKKLLSEGKERSVVKLIVCPRCGATVLDKDGIPVDPEDVKNRKLACEVCKEPMWQAKETGPRRFAIAEHIKRKHRKFFDLLVIDECHEYRGRGTAQGTAIGNMASVCKKSLGLTGTLAGGYASSIFHLLYRITRRFKDDYGHDQVGRWIDHYGIWEKVTKYTDAQAYNDNSSSKGRKYVSSPREKPGISPVILPKYLLDKTVFIRLSDIAIDLPTLTEEIIDVEMSQEQENAYNDFYEDLRTVLLSELKKGNKSLLAVYLQSLLTYPDRCTVGEQIYNKADVLIASAPGLNSDVLYPKEQALIDMVKKEKAEGRKVLIFCTHTNRRDVTARLQEKIQSNGNNIRSEILKASVPAEKREAWIKDHAGELDCLITNPALVQTGLDLIEFPTIAYCQSGYSVYTLRQSSRRSHRIGQEKPVKILYYVYTGTMQEQALKLLALKMKASLVIEGELGEDGLATYNIGHDNLFYELARNIANNVNIEDGLDSIWRSMQEHERDSVGSDLLIESLDDFKNEPGCLNGALKIPVAEIKKRYNPKLLDELYTVMMKKRGETQDLRLKRRKKREAALPENRHKQIGLF